MKQKKARCLSILILLTLALGNALMAASTGNIYVAVSIQINGVQWPNTVKIAVNHDLCPADRRAAVVYPQGNMA